jgi:hypothetical protein
MSARGVASRILLVLGLSLVGLALVVLAAFRLGLVATEGMADLGLVVGAMMMGGLGGALCALSLLVAPRRGLTRPQAILAAVGCLPALLAGIAFASTGASGPRVIGLLLVALAVAGPFFGSHLLRGARQRAL